MAPKVFVCHATEDKDRFVLEFARRLRENGVQAWLDHWEMLPGDSLVDKIFGEGLKEANAVVVVVSKHSIQKRWVREELNASIVQRIERACKIVPVVIDECEVPEALKSTIWEKVADLNNYDGEFARILGAIFGHYEKPPLGPAPAYVQAKERLLPNLNKADTLVFKSICEIYLETGNENVTRQETIDRCATLAIHQEEVDESLAILDSQGYFERPFKLSEYARGCGRIQIIRISTYGFNEYAREWLPNYEKLVRDIGFCICNEGLEDATVIEQRFQQPKSLIGRILDTLEDSGFIKQIKPLGVAARIFRVEPQLKRWLQQFDSK
jgi:hypothetical protein